MLTEKNKQCKTNVERTLIETSQGVNIIHVNEHQLPEQRYSAMKEAK